MQIADKYNFSDLANTCDSYIAQWYACKLKGGSKSEARSGDSGQTKGWKMLRAAVNVKSAFKQQRPSIMKMKSVKEVTEL